LKYKKLINWTKTAGYRCAILAHNFSPVIKALALRIKRDSFNE